MTAVLLTLSVLSNLAQRCQITHMNMSTCSSDLTETGRMCLVKCAEESLKIFLIEIRRENVLGLNGRHLRFHIFTEWASEGLSTQRYYDLNKNSDTGRNRRIKFDMPSTSAETELSVGDLSSSRETTKSALTRALNSVQNSQLASYTYSKDSKLKTAAAAGLSSESSYRKILLASRQSNAGSAAADKDAHSPSRSQGQQTSIISDNDVHSDYYKSGRKNSESENERRVSQIYKTENDSNDQDMDRENLSQSHNQNDRDKGLVWNSGNIGVSIPSIELSLLHDGNYRPMTANTPRPIPFENEFFAGHLLLLVNTKPICAQYFKRFEGRE